jgi:hypothetical protein
MGGLAALANGWKAGCCCWLVGGIVATDGAAWNVQSSLKDDAGLETGIVGEEVVNDPQSAWTAEAAEDGGADVGAAGGVVLGVTVIVASKSNINKSSSGVGFFGAFDAEVTLDGDIIGLTGVGAFFLATSLALEVAAVDDEVEGLPFASSHLPSS